MSVIIELIVFFGGITLIFLGIGRMCYEEDM